MNGKVRLGLTFTFDFFEFRVPPDGLPDCNLARLLVVDRV